MARFAFYLLVASLLVAFAALLGTGDIELSGGSSDSFSTTFKTLIFGTIAASLLPYLTPRRLIQSGTNPKNVGERYVFWLTTRALAYGVPFLFVAYFARENISHYNDYRDDRLVRSDIVDWAPASPMWAPLVNREVGIDGQSIWTIPDVSKDSKEQSKQNYVFVDKIDALRNVVKSGELSPENIRGQLGPLISKRVAGLTLQELQKFRDLRKELNENQPKANELRPELPTVVLAMIDFQVQRRWEERLALKELDDDELVRDGDGKFKHPLQDAEISFLNRWWHLFAHLGEQFVGDKAKSSQYLLAEIVEARKASRDAQDRVIDTMNRELVKADFYNRFLPSEVFVGTVEVKEGKESASQESPSGEKLTRTTSDVRRPLAAEFERVSAFHPNGSAEQWGQTLRTFALKPSLLSGRAARNRC